MKDLSDSELLGQYASHQSEEAFRELVERHVDLVYSSTLRQLGNPHLAEEATQSAFIALASHGRQLRRDAIIAGWLHRAAHFAALNLLRGEARRKHRETEASRMNEPTEDEQAFHEHALPHVDAALADLREADRNAVILRFLKQMSLREVAEALGTSEEAAKKRVTRALEKLRQALMRRGVPITATTIAAGLSQMPVTAAPVAFPAVLAALAVKTIPASSLTASLLSFGASAKMKLTVAAALALLGGLAFLLRPEQAVTSVASANSMNSSPMKIKLNSVMVDDQEKALKFYTEIFGFRKKRDLPAGEHRWLTVVSPEDPEGAELLLEPTAFGPAKVFQKALFDAEIPLTSFQVDDVRAAYQQLLQRGAKFSTPPTAMGPTTVAVLDDTCGNHIQIEQSLGSPKPVPSIVPRIHLASVMVDDQEKALQFYTGVLGFLRKIDIPAGGARWLTVVSVENKEGTQLLLEPMGFAPAKVYQKALLEAGIPWTSFGVENVKAVFDRLKGLGVEFTQAPTNTGPVTVAVFKDTCGNLIQIFSPN